MELETHYSLRCLRNAQSGLRSTAAELAKLRRRLDKMLREKCIEDTAEHRIAGKFVRFELSPENDDPFVPIDIWVFKIDQDELP